MTSEYAYIPRKCAITGTTQGLGAFRLIDLATNFAKASELQVCDISHTPSLLAY